ncbi:cadherin-like beta sandwich domain-containing protein [Desulfitobacterium sp. AusDCA]|uniref:cadherin-like beta sandwich domain-containing protein n=1 Tax=Desulfitobacterium sp. AusDCA TaxID=3240383 RepID=UPI003DA7736E
MSNIALNKAADASSSVYPYTPAKGIDGSVTPFSRWLGSSPIPASPGVPGPNWLRVDLGSFCWVNRWVVRQMGGVGWSTNFNLTDYKFQGSLDNSNWFDLDGVTDNSANSTDRTISPCKVRWVRVYITKGLRCNTNFASIVDFEVYDAPPTDSTLSSLSLSSGTATVPINPPFDKTVKAYTATTGFDIASITVTPITTDPNATVSVNDVQIPRGQSSQPINLTAGDTTAINAVVTPVIGDPKTYTVNVTRASSPYLSGLTVKNARTTVALNPSFAKETLSYSGAVSSSTTNVTVTATAEASNAVIKINNTLATSGQPFTVLLNTGANSINIEVTAGTGSDKKLYVINITRQ